MKKIAFVGSTCVGKTPLLQAFARQFAGQPDVICLQEAGRQFFSQNPIPPEKRLQAKIQLQVFARAKDQEVAAEKQRPRLLLCDRSVFDATRFMVMGGHHELADQLLKDNWTQVCSYDKIYLLDPADIPNVTDELRPEDDASRVALHQNFINFFKDYSLEYELLSGALPERIAKVQAYLCQ